MKIICNTQQLAEAVSNTQKAVMTKTTMPILEGILLKTEENSLRLTGYDLEIAIVTNIEAQIIEPGELIINAKVFSDIIRHIPYDQTIIEAGEDLNCKIYCGNIEYKMTGIDPKEYPELVVPDNTIETKFPGRTLKDMIRKTIFSVAVTDLRMIHKGIKFEIHPGELRLVAIDSHRIAIRSEFMETQNTLEFVVPSKTMNELMRLIPDDDSFVEFILDKSRILFKTSGYTIVSRLLEGEFMKYGSIIPKTFNSMIEVETEPLIRSLERVSLIINERFKAPLKMEFQENNIRVSASTALGAATDMIDATVDGDELEIGIQSRYILDALRACEQEKINIKLVNPLSPVCITPTDGEQYLYLILPVRLTN